MKHRTGEALDAMRQCVRAGGGGEFGRQAASQFGVEEDQPGEQLRMEEDRLALRGVERDHRAAPDFAAGACGRRNGYERSQAGPVGLVIKSGEVEPGPSHKQTRGLADIERTAAAQGNDTVTIVGAKCLRRIHDVLLERVGMDSGAQEPVPALFLRPQRLPQRFKGGRAEQPGIGHHQRPLESQGFQPRGQLRQRACAEQRGRGE